MGRPRKKPIEQTTQPTAESTAEVINNENKESKSAIMEETKTQQNKNEIPEWYRNAEKDKEAKENIAKLTKERDGYKAQLDALQKQLNERDETIKNKDSYIAQLEGDLVTANDDGDNSIAEIAELREQLEAAQKHNAEIEAQLETAEKHNTEIKQNITGKLQIPLDDFARKCYLTWCEGYSKDPRWSDNYKQNTAQFEKWGLAPNYLNMPILMVLANMLGKVADIRFDYQIPQDVVRKIAEDCKSAEK